MVWRETVLKQLPAKGVVDIRCWGIMIGGYYRANGNRRKKGM